MRVLLDTHCWLWFYLGDARLSGAARRTIEDQANVKLVSPASYWELAIKVSMGKYQLTETYAELVQHALYDNGFVVLPIEPGHTAVVASLPFPRGHKDPFDRLLAGQALSENIHIVSDDEALDAAAERPSPRGSYRSPHAPREGPFRGARRLRFA